MKTKMSNKLEDKHTLNLGQLLKVEREFIRSKRANNGQSINIEEDLLGISLSGGGIRSATICLGIIEELNRVNLVEKADYLSSVSGGGYLASYIHAERNKSTPTSYDQLFNDKIINQIRESRTHLFIWANYKLLSIIAIFFIAVLSFILNWLWLLLPFCFYLFTDLSGIIFYVTILILSLIPAFTLSPNFTSLHRYYKNRLRKAYLRQNKSIKLKNLIQENSPYPLINATVHVDKDDYDQSDSVSYRGRISTNYFLFSPLFCGSQVTQYTKTSKSLYSHCTLATAMATSGAAVNTFMGNVNLIAPLRWLMILTNMRTGLLAPSPLLERNLPVFFPAYTFLEILGKAKTTSYKIQISDGGHIENLGIYELLRRQVKTIIAVDSGQDDEFEFSDLRNLIVRARNELGAIIEFGAKNNPLNEVKASLITGASDKHFVVGKISGLKGSYSENYTGVLLYIKSSVLPTEKFKLRELKKEVDALKRSKNIKEFEIKRKELDYTMYRTYTPDFPHQSTSDQFYTKEQWDAYYHLGKNIGRSVIVTSKIEKMDSRIGIHNKILNFTY